MPIIIDYLLNISTFTIVRYAINFPISKIELTYFNDKYKYIFEEQHKTIHFFKLQLIHVNNYVY